MGTFNSCIGNSGNLTITGGKLSTDGNQSNCVSNVSGTLTMTGGTLTAQDKTDNWSAIGIDNSGTAVINGGTIVSTSAYGTGISSSKSLTISESTGATISISGGYYGIYSQGSESTLTIASGTIVGGSETSTSPKAVCVTSSGTLTMTGGTVRADGAGNDVYGLLLASSTADIKGSSKISSTSTGSDAYAIMLLDASDSSLAISGTVSVEGVCNAIYNGSTKTTDNGGVYIVDASVKTSGAPGFAIVGASGSLTKLAGSATVEAAGDGITLIGSAALQMIGGTVISATENTILLPLTASEQLATVFGKTVHGSQHANIGIKGAPYSGACRISSANYPDASVIAYDAIFDAWTSDSGFSNTTSSINGATLSMLTSDTYLKTGTIACVKLAAGSLGTAGDGKITVDTNKKYKVTVGSLVYFANANGVLSLSASDAAALTGTEIKGLTNGITYYVEEYSTSIVLATGSLGTAGNTTVTGLASGTKYKVTAGSTVYYVKADGTLSTSSSDAAALTGSEISELTNGTTYKVEVYTTGGGGTGGAGGYTPTTDTGAKIEVGGNTKSAGKTETSTKDGKTTTTVSLTHDDITKVLEGASTGAKVTIPITTGSATASGRLDGQAVKDMEKKDATLVIDTGSASYTLPASDINIDAVSGKFGNSVSLSDIAVNVSISTPSEATAKVVANAAVSGGFSIQVPAVVFTVSCTYGGQIVEVSTFNSYVERIIAIPDGVDPSKITTGIVVEPDGSTHHVPTEVIIWGKVLCENQQPDQQRYKRVAYWLYGYQVLLGLRKRQHSGLPEIRNSLRHEQKHDIAEELCDPRGSGSHG